METLEYNFDQILKFILVFLLNFYIGTSKYRLGIKSRLSK